MDDSSKLGCWAIYLVEHCLNKSCNQDSSKWKPVLALDACLGCECASKRLIMNRKFMVM